MKHYRNIKYLFFCVVFLIIIVPVNSVICAETAQAGLLDEDEILIEDSPLSLDDEFFDPVELKIPSTGSEIENGLQNLIRQARFTSGYNLSYQMGEPEKVVEERASLRVEWNWFFLDNYCLFADGKVTAFSGNDHRAEAADKSGFIEEDLRVMYLQAGFENFSICAGKQIVVWGEADGGVVTDVISPRNRSEFVFTNLEESRGGQYLLLFDFYSDSGTWSFILNPDPGFDENPEPGTEYFIEIFPQEQFEINEETPDISDVEYSFRWKRTFGKSDFSFMAGDLVQNQPVYMFKGSTDQGRVRLLKSFSRFQMAGFTANYSSGDFLWKEELAYKHDRIFQNQNIFENSGVIEKNTIDAALGVEYSAGRDITLGFEASNRFILDWEKSTSLEHENETELTAVWQQDFMHQTFNSEYIFSFQIQNRYMVHKLKSKYKFTDRFQGSLSMSYLDFQKENSHLRPLREKYRATVRLLYQWGRNSFLK